ncbi:MAG TPA: 50S ribosome-binding GTPase [Phycisphaerae bacterium]|nr:50S ribosome-binding GTPase [Phycisphaerae bacterium]HRR83789.1 50S ribosome-binding GTPase [Phycisphaerae bacterium]
MMLHDPATDMSETDALKAACLTPPAMGGVAVIEVVGRHALRVVAKYLRSRRPIDPNAVDTNEVRLCRWADGDQVIDDALVTVRRAPDGPFVVDISLHGGPRIVQRALLMLQQAGVRIVEPTALLDDSCPAATVVEREILPLLLRAKTRAVAIWLAELVHRLPKRIEAVLDLIEVGEATLARRELAALCQSVDQARYLLSGVRVVVIGPPNTGKSTLINRLASREQAVVSDQPGTTRDWVEHPGVIDGIPLVFVDTAGIRDTADPIEQEAIRRTYQQASTADILLSVSDLTTPLETGLPPKKMTGDQSGMIRVPPIVLVANKSDLPAHPSWQNVQFSEAGFLQVSALASAGLEDLEARLVDSTGLTGWRQKLIAPVSPHQVACCRGALSALESGRADPPAASRWLRDMLGPASPR